MKKTTRLKKLILDPKILIMPGAYDALSAKIIERAGFQAVQASGYGIAASYLGMPDVGLLTMSEMLDQTRRIARAVDIPVMGDGDTGFGNAINVYRTVQEFEAAGVAGINLEDQIFPKRCGHMEGKEIVSLEEMVKKIEAAVAARRDPDFVINAGPMPSRWLAWRRPSGEAMLMPRPGPISFLWKRRAAWRRSGGLSGKSRPPSASTCWMTGKRPFCRSRSWRKWG